MQYTIRAAAAWCQNTRWKIGFEHKDHVVSSRSSHGYLMCESHFPTVTCLDRFTVILILPKSSAKFLCNKQCMKLTFLYPLCLTLLFWLYKRPLLDKPGCQKAWKVPSLGELFPERDALAVRWKEDRNEDTTSWQSKRLIKEKLTKLN